MEQNISTAVDVLYDEIEMLNDVINALELTLESVLVYPNSDSSKNASEPVASRSILCDRITGAAAQVRSRRERVYSIIDALDLPKNDVRGPQIDSPMVHATVPRR